METMLGEFKAAFLELKSNKSCDHDKIRVNVLEGIFDDIHIFNITELVDAILNGFSGEKYTLGVFIDLPFYGSINIYSIKNKSLSWF